MVVKSTCYCVMLSSFEKFGDNRALASLPAMAVTAGATESGGGKTQGGGAEEEV